MVDTGVVGSGHGYLLGVVIILRGVSGATVVAT